MQPCVVSIRGNEQSYLVVKSKYMKFYFYTLNDFLPVFVAHFISRVNKEHGDNL